MRGGGEVSVAWPGQGHNRGEKGEEIPPVCICTGLVSGMVLAQPQPPPCPPAHLSASGVWECWLEATREGKLQGPAPRS